MSWDPARYLRFADHRARPGVELLARVPDLDADHIVDLGCGTGGLTAMLAQRWPDAEVFGIDSSPAMLERARRDHPALRWHTQDIDAWRPQQPVDLLFSNAALHWCDDHRHLFPRLLDGVRPGGVLAVQMPDNWREPTHTVPARILDHGTWPAAARAALPRDRVAAPADYRAWLAARCAALDLWETTYHHELHGDDAVLDWVLGSLLRPVVDALGSERDCFLDACRLAYRAAYPPQADGTTLLPFRRLFLVATARRA